jgi:predicted nuclease of predicted toxin-antitoxin system
VRLLFDQNLSPRLVGRLADLHPDSAHVHTLGLDRADDGVVWEYAREHGYAIVTKDADFGDLSVLRGFPPKVIWIRLGNCTTRQVEALFRSGDEIVVAFENDPAAGLLTLY